MCKYRVRYIVVFIVNHLLMTVVVDRTNNNVTKMQA